MLMLSEDDYLHQRFAGLWKCYKNKHVIRGASRWYNFKACRFLSFLATCHAKDQDWEEKDLIKKRAEAAEAAEHKWFCGRSLGGTRYPGTSTLMESDLWDFPRILNKETLLTGMFLTQHTLQVLFKPPHPVFGVWFDSYSIISLERCSPWCPPVFRR